MARNGMLKGMDERTSKAKFEESGFPYASMRQDDVFLLTVHFRSNKRGKEAIWPPLMSSAKSTENLRQRPLMKVKTQLKNQKMRAH